MVVRRSNNAQQNKAQQMELVQGTLDMLILKAVSLGPLHGYGVLLRIQQISGEELVIQQGSLYPALYRLEHQGAIASSWGESENNRRAKYYRLTRAGRERLEAEAEKWNRMAGVIAGILRTRRRAHDAAFVHHACFVAASLVASCRCAPQPLRGRDGGGACLPS
jgi:PadR family transcriptional regulator PadR